MTTCLRAALPDWKCFSIITNGLTFELFEEHNVTCPVCIRRWLRTICVNNAIIIEGVYHSLRQTLTFKWSHGKLTKQHMWVRCCLRHTSARAASRADWLRETNVARMRKSCFPDELASPCDEGLKLLHVSDDLDILSMIFSSASSGWHPPPTPLKSTVMIPHTFSSKPALWLKFYGFFGVFFDEERGLEAVSQKNKKRIRTCWLRLAFCLHFIY